MSRKINKALYINSIINFIANVEKNSDTLRNEFFNTEFMFFLTVGMQS